MQTDKSSLEKNELFRNIAPREIEEILTCLLAIEKSYGKSSDIIELGSTIEFLGILTKGTAQVVQTDAFGNRKILHEIKEGDVFAEAIAAVKCKQSPISVVAVTNCTVIWIAAEKIVDICKKHCAFHKMLSSNLMQIIAKKNIYLNEKIELLSCRTTRAKLCMYLMNQANKEGSLSFKIGFSRDELADFLSVDRSAMSRELSHLQKEGKIKYKKNEFQLNPREFSIREGEACY